MALHDGLIEMLPALKPPYEQLLIGASLFPLPPFADDPDTSLSFTTYPIRVAMAIFDSAYISCGVFFPFPSSVDVTFLYAKIVTWDYAGAFC